MRRSGRCRCLGLLLPVLLASAVGGCKKQVPDESAPWVVILDEVSTRRLAEQRAEQLVEQHPEQLERAGVLTISAQGVHTHLVITEGYPNREGAREQAAALRGSTMVRLPVVDVTSFKLAGEETERDATAPEGTGQLEQLAALLPAPGQTARLEAFVLLADPAATDPALTRSFGHKSPREWWKQLLGLGWKAAAEAVYLPPGSDEPDARIFVFAGWLGEGGDAQTIDRVHEFLRERLVPTEEEWEAIESEKKKRSRRRRRRRRRRQRREPPVEAEPAEPVALPAATKKMLPWGAAAVHQVERVGFPLRAEQKRDTPARTAWLVWAPENQAVVLVLFSPGSEPIVNRLLRPYLLGVPRGISVAAPVRHAWSVLPEVLAEGEQLVTLAMDDLAAQLDRKRRRQDWFGRLGKRPVFAAGYRTPATSWSVVWTDMGSEPDAQRVYQSAYVKPRQEMIQRTVLGRKRSVRYDVGVSLREIGTTQGWYLRGARRGRMQELYFRLGTAIWLLQAPTRGEKAFGADDLLARVELLRIWEEPE